MNILHLTIEERSKFANWLDQEVTSDEGILFQLKVLKMPEVAIQHKENEIKAKRLVAKILRSIEETSL